MNTKIIDNFIKTKRGIFLTFLLILTFSLICFYLLNGNIIRDTGFHISRIYEIRYAFEHNEFPNWLNFQSFFGIGQAINGMYPDLTLWPLVFLTMPFSKTHQIILIKLLIYALVIIVTYYSLRKKKFDFESSLCSGVIYAFSGWLLSCLFDQFQSGTMIIQIFAFPISFILYDIMFTNKFNLMLSCKFGLCILLIIYSHLLSAVVLAYIMLGMFLYAVIIKKFGWQSVYNILLSGIVAILGGLPIIYRYLVISSSNLAMPYGQGNIDPMPFYKIFNRPYGFTILNVLLMILAFYFSKNRKKLLPLLLMEIYIYVLCTNLFPWKLFNNFPIINNLQWPQFRFGIWLSVVPLLMILYSLKDNTDLLNKVLYLLSIVCLIMCIVKGGYKTFIKYNPNKLTPNNYSRLIKVAGNYNYKDSKVNEYMYYDYAPKLIQTMYGDGIYLGEDGRKSILHPYIHTETSKVRLKKVPINNGVELIPLKSVSSSNNKIILPILGYKTLTYKTYINGKSVGNSIFNAYLGVKAKKINKGEKVTILFKNPLFYNYLIVFTGIYLLLLVIILLKY